MIGQASKKAVAFAAAVLILTAVIAAVIGKELLGSNAAETASSTNAALQDAKAKVPFLGPFAQAHKGDAQCGPAVRLMEGALRNTKPAIRKTKAQNCIGAATTKQLKTFQKRHGIAPSGIYGLRTHNALASHYTKTQLAGLEFLAAQKLESLRYAEIGVITAHAKVFESRMQYCDNGSLAECGLRAVWPAWPDVPRNTDCSGYVQWVYFQAGIPDPNGIGVGSTKTLILHGTPVGPSGPLKIGDLIFYGDDTHVAIYIGHGLVSSHGEPGIHIEAYAYRPIYAVRRYF